MNTSNPQILALKSIRKRLEFVDIFEAIKSGFISYSNGDAVIPPVGELIFEHPPGDVHIKYGYLKSHPYYVVKIASGFYENPKKGLPSSQGLNLLFDKNTGFLNAVLLDEGYLTDVRTAVAGALASEALAKSNVNRIGIVGAGIQARYQIEYHHKLFPDAHFQIWNRQAKTIENLQKKITDKEVNLSVVADLKELCLSSDVIVTTTPSREFLIHQDWVSEGSHITAVGSDTDFKIELDPLILKRADKVVVDSLDQSESRGEVYRACSDGLLNRENVIELGNVLRDSSLGRQSDQDITIVDLTGVAVQDLMISQAVFEGN